MSKALPLLRRWRHVRGLQQLRAYAVRKWRRAPGPELPEGHGLLPACLELEYGRTLSHHWKEPPHKADDRISLAGYNGEDLRGLRIADRDWAFPWCPP